MFGWLQARRRRRRMAEPFPTAWEDLLRRHVKYAERLPTGLAAKWRQRIQVFVNETTWEGCRGLDVTDEVRVVISAYAMLLTLGFEDEWLGRVRHVLVHPTPYQGRRARIAAEGIDYSHGDWMQQIEEDTEDEHLGEAWCDCGTVVIAWCEVPTAEHVVPIGTNVVVHEFAHVILDSLSTYVANALTEFGELWRVSFQGEYDRQVRDAHQNQKSLLDDYSAESPEEFFCVAAECFFERPSQMQSQRRTLFSLLKQCFRIDPTTWRPIHGSSPAE